MPTNQQNLEEMTPDDIEESLRQAKQKSKQRARAVLGQKNDYDPATQIQKYLDKTYTSRRKAQTGGYVYEKDLSGGGKVMEEVPFLKKRPSRFDEEKGLDLGQTTKEELARHPERLEQILGKSGKAGQPSPLSKLEQAGAYSNDQEKRKEQEQAAGADISKDYTTESFKAKHGVGSYVGEPGKGKNLAGKVSGKGIGAIAEHGGAVSAGIIYGLALLNDFPDLAGPIINFFTIGTGAIVNFLFDVVVFLGLDIFSGII